MKFMIRWVIHPTQRAAVMATFAGMPLSEFQSQQGPDVNVIGRWHDTIGFTGVVICETESSEALALWLLQWNSVADFDVIPVLDDAEAHANAKKALGMH